MGTYACIERVHILKKLRDNLLSVSEACKKGNVFIFTSRGVQMYDSVMKVAVWGKPILEGGQRYI